MSKTLDLRALKAFVVTAREGNVSRAAQKLNLTQPAVSLQLKQLAEITGLNLFSRTSNGVLLTRDGATLLQHAERALQAQSDFLQAAHRMKGVITGTLRIGTILDPEFTRLGAFLRELVALAPEIQPQLRQGMSGEVMDALLKGELDVAYALSPALNAKGSRRLLPIDDERLHTRPLTRFTYRVVAPPGWGPQIQGRDWPELVRLPWIMTPPASVHHRLIAAKLEPLGLSQNGVAMVDQESSMLALVRSGVGLCLARDSLAIQESHAHGLDVADRVSLDAVMSFARLAKAEKSAAVKLAFDAMSRAWTTILDNNSADG
ncbi:MAG TPA: LysR family transcriptional regulator [Burkholderiaceae bacterium]